MERLRLRIAGRVQGVGYRWFVRETAQEAGASGWVRNEPDGSVSAELQAGRPELQALLQLLKTGNCAAHVSEITANQIPVVPQETGFEIKF